LLNRNRTDFLFLEILQGPNVSFKRIVSYILMSMACSSE
jgi:hypothetical protein